MSVSQKDVLHMNKKELSVLLNKSRIQHDQIEDVDDMRELYLKHMIETSSESEESEMSTGNRPTVEEVKQMDIFEISDHLEQCHIEFEDVETVEEMQDLYLKHIHPSDSSQQEDSSNSAVMEEVIENDQMKREKLKEIYDMLIECLGRKHEGLEEIKSIIEITNENFVGNLVANREKLCDNECPIVIAGETSAGKSTLLNLLLGTDILPHSLLGTTAAICHLHKCSKKRFEIHTENDSIITEEVGSDEEMSEKLKPYITAREETKPKYKRVDVYWPFAMLHENVTIINTPGIGESDQLTDLLLTYLPNAVAFIYVINANNSGGIQEDYLLEILKKQAEWAMNDLSNAIDYESTLFVCNKWDKIKTEEIDAVRKYIINRITKLLPDFHQEHILTMRATVAQRYRKNGLGLTSDFENFLKGFEKLTAGSMTGKRRKYCMLLRSVLQKLQFTLSTRINHAEQAKCDKENLKKVIIDRLFMLTEKNEKVKSELLGIAKDECLEIFRKLWEYVQDKDVKQKILSWEDHDIPDVQSDWKVTKHMAEKKIQSRIVDVIKDWEERNHFVKKITEKMRKKFISQNELLTAEFENIKMVILGSNERKVKEVTPSADREDVKLPTEFKVAAAVTAPIWVPLSLAVVIIVLPVAFGKAVVEHAKESFQQSKFKKNKAKYMTAWAQKAVDATFTEANIRRIVEEVYLSALKKEIENICTHFIPKQIEEAKQLIKNIYEDTRKSEEILYQFQPLLKEVERIQTVLNEFADLK